MLALQQDVAVSASEVACCKISTNCAKLSEEAFKTKSMKILCCNTANSQYMLTATPIGDNHSDMSIASSQHFSGATLKTDLEPRTAEGQFLRMSETGRRTNGKRKRFVDYNLQYHE
ncbi:hypothetical protein Acear_0294 [Acetohalobium arabaticum DSM 5501]|uniref:Uncharacterized protein n=1 Tax=Acetohalobium arabaticum (strain ATCC 49924 / DSM 5501 / Z-7288) TaxID=574087 RepID=D9QU50_ACEAZ|nr:hypothetical protein Acear_0294 [Acetohalobium arabaticum DSM 5501]